jgi:hypothetical protein
MVAGKGGSNLVARVDQIFRRRLLRLSRNEAAARALSLHGHLSHAGLLAAARSPVAGAGSGR